MKTSLHKYFFFLILVSFNGYTQSPIKKIFVNGVEKPFKNRPIIFLSALDDDLVIEFAHTKKDTSKYFIQLQNFDKNWITTTYPTIRYTNLAGGTYTLFWRTQSSKISRVNIVVEKSLTEEWWFLPSIIIYIILLVSAAIYFFLLYNLRQKVKLQAIRNRIAADLHDEVGSTLNSIAIFSRLAEKKLGKKETEIHQILDKIKADSEETVHTIRDTVWAINADNDSILVLFEKMRSIAYQVLAAKDIPLDFENTIDESKLPKISMEQRRNVYLIFKEAINNIVKHAEASQVQIKITKQKSDILIHIEDDGVGFNLSNQYDGNGLKNYRRRAEEGFMEVTINSEPQKGTKINILIHEI